MARPQKARRCCAGEGEISGLAPLVGGGLVAVVAGDELTDDDERRRAGHDDAMVWFRAPFPQPPQRSRAAASAPSPAAPAGYPTPAPSLARMGGTGQARATRPAVSRGIRPLGPVRLGRRLQPGPPMARLPARPEQAALQCLYLAIISLDPTGRGRQRWLNRWMAALNDFHSRSAGRKLNQGSSLHKELADTRCHATGPRSRASQARGGGHPA